MFELLLKKNVDVDYPYILGKDQHFVRYLCIFQKN